MISIEQHSNHYLEGMCQFARSQEAAFCFAWGRGNHGNCDGSTSGTCHTDRVSGIDYIHLPHTYPYVLFTGELVGGTIDRAAVRETQHGNHATQMCPLAHWVTTYVQQTVHVTQRHSYLHQSRHRDSATANVTQPSQLFTPASQRRHGGSNSSGSSAIVTHRHM